MFGGRGFGSQFFGELDQLVARVRGAGGTPIDHRDLDRLERRWVRMVEKSQAAAVDRRRTRLDRTAEEEDAMLLALLDLV